MPTASLPRSVQNRRNLELYRSRCELYLYSEPQIRSLFDGLAGVEVRVESIARDWFVTAAKR